MASSPQFTSEPTIDYASIPVNQGTSSTVQSNMRNGTAGDSLYTLVASGPSGSAGAGVGKRITRVKATPACSGTSALSNSVLCFYYKRNTALTNNNDYVLLAEVFVPYTSFNTGVATESLEVYELAGLVLPGGSGIYANYLGNTSGSVKVVVEGGLL